MISSPRRTDIAATGRRHRYPLWLRIGAVLLAILLYVAVLEAFARLRLPLTLALIPPALSANLVDLAPDEYKVPDPNVRALWRLRPGVSETLAEAIRSKTYAGHVLGADYLRQRGTALGVASDETIYSIDTDGFKGPQVDGSHASTRILTLGDSVTFGPLFDRYSYPRVLERDLRAAGREVEVVNGAVEGYAPEHVLLRIQEYQRLRPEVTTVLIGWNSLYAERLDLTTGLAGNFALVHVASRAAQRINLLRLGPQQAALNELARPKRADPTAPELALLDDYQPSFLPDVERIIDAMRAVGSRVVLLTLPGLFDLDEPTTEAAIAKGHLPPFTDNDYVLAKMARRYNNALRDMADRKDVQVIDLEQWSKTTLQPRDAFFLDSVHLYEEGLVTLGDYLAE